MSPEIEKFAGLLASAGKIVFLTGAGMSTESGIPDFRSPTGLYATVASEDVFDIELFRHRPEEFYRLAQQLLGGVRHARPNAGHLAIAELATKLGKDVTVVTQNIDTLHQMAGRTVVYPVHGTLETATCQKCEVQVRGETLWPEVAAGTVPRHRVCGGVFKPDIVFFGEMLPADVLFAAEQAVRRADLLVVAGTSLTVYPAAALPGMRSAACPLVIINRTATPLDGRAQVRFQDSIGSVMEQALGILNKEGSHKGTETQR